MALFGLKRNKKPGDSEEKKETKTVKSNEAASFEISKGNRYSVLMFPRVTEKVSMLSETQNVYTFNIDEDATKNDIKKAVKELYKVEPVKVRIVAIPKKKTFVRGKSGSRKGGKKAYIYLKKGDKIELA